MESDNTIEIVGSILAVLSVLVWIADAYLSHKLKSYLTPKDSYHRTRWDESDDKD